jgi:MFS family permease
MLAVVFSATVYTTVQGLTYPLLSLILERAGANSFTIGLSAAMMPLGMVAAGVVGPRLVHRIGSLPLLVASLLTAAGMLVLLKLSGTAELVWFPARFVIGLAIACVFVVTDVWINRLATDSNRGRVVGIYAAAMSVGFAIGPALLAVVGTTGWLPFVLACAFVAAAAVPLPLVRHLLPADDAGSRPGGGAGSFVRLAPALIGFVALVALVEQATLALFPVWALDSGLGERSANVMLALMAVGSIALSVPIGWAADRIPAHRVIAVCCLATAITIGSLPLLAGSTVLAWIMMFLFGGAYYGVYVVALAILGNRFSGAVLVSGSAAFGASWGIGGLVGPFALGTSTQGLGIATFPLTIAILVAAAIPVALAWRNLRS